MPLDADVLASSAPVPSGWYPIRACLDLTLTAAVRAGRLRVGDKLFVSSAVRGGSDVPAPPLEGYSASWLCLGANGTRRAPWDARLGRLRGAPLLPLRHVRPGGGSVPSCAVTIARVHPLIYIEKTYSEDADGNVTETKTMRSAAAEAAAAAKHEAAADAVREAAATAAVDKHERERAMQRTGARRAANEEHADAAAAQRSADAQNAALSAAVSFAVQAALEERRLTPRDVMPMLKLRVTGFAPPGCPEPPGEAIITGTLWLCISVTPCNPASNASAIATQCGGRMRAH